MDIDMDTGMDIEMDMEMDMDMNTDMDRAWKRNQTTLIDIIHIIKNTDTVTRKIYSIYNLTGAIFMRKANLLDMKYTSFR